VQVRRLHLDSAPARATIREVLTWDDGIAGIRDSDGASARFREQRWNPLISRTPIVVTGSPGAGKTELWRRLTGRDAPEAVSTDIDQALFFPRRRKSVAVTTIPGQESDDRARLMLEYFGPRLIVKGVVFVATYGFNHIWPSQAEPIARNLTPVADVNTLSEHNLDIELESFRDTCSRIKDKFSIAPREYAPDWLLVLANKTDLYWDGVEHAREYYQAGSESPFGRIAGALLAYLGQGRGFDYHLLPIALRAENYSFLTTKASFVVETQLSADAVSSSIETLGRALEGLCEA
jgi:hypothetical protein